MLRSWLWLPLLASVAAAQILVPVPIPAPTFPKSLRDYLQLTDAQVKSVTEFTLGFDTFSSTKQARIADVQADLARKTAAEPLDSLALGMGYAEIEAIRRDVNDKRTELRANLSKTLTDPQRTRLKTLDSAQSLLPLASSAVCQNLLATPPALIPNPFDGSGSVSGGTIGGIIGVITTVPVVVGSLSGCPIGLVSMPADLAAYLALTPDQVTAIAQLNATYARFYTEKQQRIAQVQADIADKTAASVLDPGALGMDYAEIEAIHRDLRDKLAGLRTDIARQLTAAQKARVQALDDARGQQSLISAAICEDLLVPMPSPWFDYTGFQVPTAILRVGDFTSGLVQGFPRRCGI